MLPAQFLYMYNGESADIISVGFREGLDRILMFVMAPSPTLAHSPLSRYRAGKCVPRPRFLRIVRGALGTTNPSSGSYSDQELLRFLPRPTQYTFQALVRLGTKNYSSIEQDFHWPLRVQARSIHKCRNKTHNTHNQTGGDR